MSLSIDEMKQRIEAALEILHNPSNDRAVSFGNARLRKAITKRFTACDTEIAKHPNRAPELIRYQGLMQLLEKLRNKQNEWPPAIQGSMYQMLSILDPLKYHPQVEILEDDQPGLIEVQPEKIIKKLTVFTRQAALNQYMHDHPERDAKGLAAWLENFYCKLYLGNCPKADAILAFLKSNQPVGNISVVDYLRQAPDENESLAELIGGNRLSLLNRSPWGLKQIIQLFQYEKLATDTTASQNTQTMFNPLL